MSYDDPASAVRDEVHDDATGRGRRVDRRHVDLVSVEGAHGPSGGLGLPSQVPELAGFRATAVLIVVFHHIFFGWKQPPQAFTGVPHAALSLLEKGWIGVDLFFVLSGLLITGILIDSKSNAHYFRNFYARRTLRIIPVYFTVITISWILYQKPAGFFLLSYGFLANFAGALGVGSPHGPGVFWSLAIEEHFYLLWPLLVWLTTRSALLAIAAGLVLLIPVLRGYCYAHGMDPENQIYLYSWFRVDGLAMGALLAIWLRSPRCNRRRSLLLAAGIFAAFLILTLVGARFGLLGTKTLASTSLRYTQMSWLFASLILGSLALHGRGITAPLRWRFMQVTAGLSYCMYLIHLIVGDMYFVVLRALGLSPRESLGPAAAFWLQLAIIAGVTCLLAALSKRFLEDPVLELKRRFV